MSSTLPASTSAPPSRRSSNASTSSSRNQDILTPPPSSIEEAGALLGAAITRIHSPASHVRTTAPPTGLHSSFSTVTPVPGTELFVRLCSLRDLLREHASMSAEELAVLHSSGSGNAVRLALASHAAPLVQPLPAAPSILAVLMKLLSISAQLATTPVLIHSSSPALSNSNSHHPDASRHATAARGLQVPPLRITPPMLSHPLRALWVQSVLICHRLASDLKGQHSSLRVDPYATLTTFIELASMNPRSAKSAGGTRIAALQVLTAFYLDSVMGPKVAPWAGESLRLCLKALKSSGSGDPMHRICAVRLATAVGVGVRRAHLERRGGTSIENLTLSFLCTTAMEDRSILEAIRILKRACEDRFPEVRLEAAEFCSAMSSMWIHSKHFAYFSSGGSGSNSSTLSSNSATVASEAASPMSSIDEAMTVALKSLDDENSAVASAWAAALARCICASIEHADTFRAAISAQSNNKRNVESDADEDGGGTKAGVSTGSDLASKFKAFSESRKVASTSQQCSSLFDALQFLIDHFIKAGGEASACRAGGSFSIGGRALRIGSSLVLIDFLKLQCTSGDISSSKGLNPSEALRTVLNMVGPTFEKQLLVAEACLITGEGMIDATTLLTGTLSEKASPPPGLFGGYKQQSPADASMARLAASRVIRQGLSALASEPTQLSLLRDLAVWCRSPTDGSISTTGESRNPANNVSLNRHQLQVSLIEISHLTTALGEAAASSLADLVPAIHHCLSHAYHGVRHEAAIAFQAIAVVFPREGRKCIMTSIDQLQLHRDAILSLATNPGADEAPSVIAPVLKRRFRRAQHTNAITTKTVVEKSLSHQYALHGNAVSLCMLLHEMPHVSGGLSIDILGIIMAVIQSLVICQDNDVLTSLNPGAVCTCVRAGYCVLSGVLTMGPTAITSHLAGVFGLWQRSGKHAEDGTKNFTVFHDLSCVDGMLSSLVTFLQSCSDLLLAVPDALNRTTQLLEKIFPVISPDGRLGGEQTNAVAMSRLNGAKASVMEAFGWLPPGSFPLAADRIFSFAAEHIKSSSEKEIPCSFLSCLVTSEDKLLDAQSMSRVSAYGQTGGIAHSEDTIVALTSECTHHAEREAVMHSLPWKKKSRTEMFSTLTFTSSLLDLVQTEEDLTKAPTPLHEVGTWKQPPTPSVTSKVRLVDAAIHVFAATFGLQDGHQQEKAMRMLVALLPLTMPPVAKTFSSSLISETTGKTRSLNQELVAGVNIAATLLSCLQALPLHEASGDTPIGMGPPWMTTATDLFYTLLPSSAPVVRRVASEGLALLASLGITEDAHTLQSSILYALDEMMQGNLPDGTPRKLQLESQSLSSVKSACLLTLGCIQRTSRMLLKETARARARFSRPRDFSVLSSSSTPTMIILTRVLPSLATHNADSDSFLARTHGLYALGLLLSYSDMVDADAISTPERHQILCKAMEVVENNFIAAWTAVNFEADKGRETERLIADPAFLAVLIRLMTLLLPRLHLLKESDSSVLIRFYNMATVMMEVSDYYPPVVFEGLVFIEALSRCVQRLSKNAFDNICIDEVVELCFPLIAMILKPSRPQILTLHGKSSAIGCHNSMICKRAAVRCLALFSEMQNTLVSDCIRGLKLHVHLSALLEVSCGSRQFSHSSMYRSVAAPRSYERCIGDTQKLELEIVLLIDSLLQIEHATPGLMHWLLFARSLVAGDADKTETVDNEDQFTLDRVVYMASSNARHDSSLVLMHANPSRWQLKVEAAKIALIALNEISLKESNFDLMAARTVTKNLCAEARNSMDCCLPPSRVELHLEDLVSAACGATIATLDQAELPLLQNMGLRLLVSLVLHFGNVAGPDESKSLSSIREKPRLLDSFLSQIVPSVKHALSAGDTDQVQTYKGEETHLLFFSGCEGLLTLVNYGLISDSAALKRIMRPLLLMKSDNIFGLYPTVEIGKANSFRHRARSIVDNGRCDLLFCLGKLCTIAEIRVLDSMTLIPEIAAADVLDEFSSYDMEIAAISAAIAIDAFRLETSPKVAAIGSGAGFSVELNHDEVKSGFTFANLLDMDESVYAGMVQTWPMLASSAVLLAVSSLSKAGVSETKRETLNDLLNQIVPLISAKLRIALECLIAFQQAKLTLADSFDKESRIAAVLLHALGTLVASDVSSTAIGPNEINVIIEATSQAVLFPQLGLVKSVEQSLGAQEISEVTECTFSLLKSKSMDRLISEVCRFIESACASVFSNELDRLVLERTLLVPLLAVDEGFIVIRTDTQTSVMIVASCTQSVRQLLASSFDFGSNDNESLTKSMIVFALSELAKISKYDSAIVQVKEAFSSLLLHCLCNPVITTNEKRIYAREAANVGSWNSWAILCSNLEDGSGLLCSLDCIRDALADLDDAPRILAAIIALRTAMHEVSTNDAGLTAYIMESIGSGILLILKVYGLGQLRGSFFGEQRLLTCVESVKVIMIAFESLVATLQNTQPDSGSEMLTELVLFLTVIFEVLVQLVSFNGFPNHPSGCIGADPALGRVCAQSFVHFARAAPAAFKESMSHLSPKDRDVLELAVRADMSGYVSSEAKTAKKKINLKGFSRG